MPWYEFRTYRRSAGGPSTGRLDQSAAFEAADDSAAKSEAYRKIRMLPSTDFAQLLDATGVQIWTGEAPGTQ